MLCRIYQGLGPTDAYLVRDWLERNQIKTWIRGEALLTLQGDVPIGQNWPSVWVMGPDRERAEEAVREFNGPVLVHPAWVCAHCREENGASFGSCWHCGGDRPGVG